MPMLDGRLTYSACEDGHHHATASPLVDADNAAMRNLLHHLSAPRMP